MNVVTSIWRLAYCRWRPWFLVFGCLFLAFVVLMSWTLHRRISLRIALQHTYDPYEDWALRGRYSGEQGVEDMMGRVERRHLAWLEGEGGTPAHVLAQLIDDVEAGKGPWVSDEPSRADLVRVVMGRWWQRSASVLAVAFLVILYPIVRVLRRILSVKCLNCGYSRRQSVSIRCPECGEFDPLWRGSEHTNGSLSSSNARDEQGRLMRSHVIPGRELRDVGPLSVLVSILVYRKRWWGACLAALVVSASAAVWLGVQERKVSRAEQAVDPYWQANVARYTTDLSKEDCIQYANLMDSSAISWLKRAGGMRAAELASAVEALKEGEFRAIESNITWFDVELEILGNTRIIMHIAIVLAVIFAGWPLVSTLRRLWSLGCVWCGYRLRGCVSIDCVKCGRQDPLWRGL